MDKALSTSAKVRLTGLVVLLLASGATIWAGLRNRPVPESPPSTPEAVLDELKAGNQRFIKSQRTRSTETRADGERRKELARDQKPIVAVLGCADSRVPPELIFDQGLGRIFDVRNAGNVVDGDVLGSLEYAVEHLHVPVVLVLGHKGCGAVKAVAEAGKEPLGHNLRAIQTGMAGLLPEVEQAKEKSPEFLVHLAEVNARQQARRLLVESDVLRKEVKEKKALIAVALYDMEGGDVQWKDFDPDAEK